MRTKKITGACFFALVLALGFSLTTGCSQNNASRLTPLTEQKDRRGLVDYRFNYRIRINGIRMAPACLWDGFDEGPFTFVGPYYGVAKEERQQTFLIDFQEEDPGYYLVYLDEDFLENPPIPDLFSKERMEEIYLANGVSHYWPSFIKEIDHRFVDGKYLYRKNLTSDSSDVLSAFWAASLENVPLRLDGKVMVLAAKRKQVHILENLSLAEQMNKSFHLYRRIGLEFDSTEIGPEIVQIPDRTDVVYGFNELFGIIGEDMFDYCGRMVEVDDPSFATWESSGIFDFRFNGIHLNVGSVDGKDSVRMITGMKSKGEMVDYLSDDYRPEKDDPYKEHKAFFRDISLKKEIIDGAQYSYFPLSSLTSFIAECASKD